MKGNIKTRIGRARIHKSGVLAGFLMSFALVFAAAPATLYAAPAGGALSSHIMMRVANDNQNYVSRGRLAQQVANAAGFHEDPGGQVFEDVPPSNHYFQWVNRLANRGVISGFSCGTTPDEPCVAPLNRLYFRPDADALRGQIAKVIANSAGFSDTPTGQSFQDVSPGSTYYLYAERLASRGLIDGYACGTAPAGNCFPPNDLPYFRAFNEMAMSDLVKVVNSTFHGH